MPIAPKGCSCIYLPPESYPFSVLSQLLHCCFSVAHLHHFYSLMKRELSSILLLFLFPFSMHHTILSIQDDSLHSLYLFVHILGTPSAPYICLHGVQIFGNCSISKVKEYIDPLFLRCSLF